MFFNWHLADQLTGLLVLINGLTLGALIIHAFLFNRQGSILQKTLEHGQIELRAYVLIDGGNIYNVVNPILDKGIDTKLSGAEIKYPSGYIKIMLGIRNSGKTPARKVNHFAFAEFREFPLSSPLAEIAKGNPSISVIASGNINTKELRHRMLTDTEITDLRNGKGAIFIRGESLGLDIFSKDMRLSQYILMYHKMGGDIGLSNTLTFYEDGNEAT